MSELKPKQIKAAFLEATGMKATDIAKELGITPQTVSAYRKMDEYQVLVSKSLDSMLRAAQCKLIQSLPDAVSTILRVMSEGSNTESLRAAESILKMVGMDDVKDYIGATSMAEKKEDSLYQSPDTQFMKEMNKEMDDFISSLGI